MVIAERYTLDREIGRGGMGAVWLGRDELLGRLVALKRVGVAPGGTSPEVVRAEREAKLAASLSHPNVVSVFDLAPDGDLQWLVMEYVEGTNLSELVSAEGAMSPDRASPILAQVAAALVAAHAAGVVHRDVKPSNILVTPDGRVKLSDFGIARTKGDVSLTQTGLVTGSPAYLSPEVASGRPATDRSDVWSLGATAYHALEGHPPYEVGDNLIGALYRIVHEPPPRPSAPGWLAPLFAATMERDAAARWDAREVHDFLATPASVGRSTSTRTRERVAVRESPVPTRESPAVGSAPTEAGPHGLTQLLAVAEEPPVPAYADDRRARRSRLPWVLSAAVVLLVLLVAGLTYVVLGGPDDAAPEASGPSTSTSASPSATSDAEPTVEAMTAFARDYLATATTDQQAGFDLLTPAYRSESGGLGRYAAFWGPVRNVEVRSIDADPAALTVTYDYSYRRGRQTRDETVTLQLERADGSYLIANATTGP